MIAGAIRRRKVVHLSLPKGHLVRAAAVMNLTAKIESSHGFTTPADVHKQILDEKCENYGADSSTRLSRFQLPKWLLRTAAAFILSGQVSLRIFSGRIHWKNTLEQLKLVGPRSLGVALLTAGFVGMVFTIQV